MAKLITWDLMTLDGFFEGRDHNIAWFGDVWGDELEAVSIEQLRAAGGLLFGRRTCQLMAAHWPGQTGTVADFMNALPKYVFSRTLTHADWNNTTLFDGADLAATVAALKQAANKDLFVFGSAALTADLMTHRLVDEVRICLTPHLLGSGAPLFKPGARPERLILRQSRPLSSGAVILRYDIAA